MRDADSPLETVAELAEETCTQTEPVNLQFWLCMAALSK